MSVLASFFILFALALVTSLASIVDLQEFLKRSPIIEELGHVSDFKRVVRRQMYLELARLLLLWLVFFCGLFLTLTGQLELTQIVFISVFAGGLFAASRAVRTLRAQVTSLPAADKGLEGLYQAVSQVWREKTLPDF